jgi:hypothetical protein
VVAVVEGCKAGAWPWPLVILHAMCEREEVVAGARERGSSLKGEGGLEGGFRGRKG